MRFMVLIKANSDTEAGILPSEELLTAMGNYNEELVKAGVMLAGEGLHPSSKGARVVFQGDKRTVVDGPFTEAKELDRGILADRREVEGRGDRVGEAHPKRAGYRPRFEERSGDPTGLRGGGLRRGVHAGTARAGRTPARGDGEEAVTRWPPSHKTKERPRCAT